MESQSKKKPADLRITLEQRLEILGNYAKTKIIEQLKSVAVIIFWWISLTRGLFAMKAQEKTW